MTNINSTNRLFHKPVNTIEPGFYQRVMGWLAICFTAATIGIFFLAPLIPASLVLPLFAVAFIGLLVASFTKKAFRNPTVAKTFAIAIPTILGITISATLNSFIASGAGNIVLLAALGTAVVFGTTAFLGWTSKKTIYHWGTRLFIILIGAIIVSLVNMLFFHAPMVSLVVSIAVFALFSVYSFMDVQAIRDQAYGDVHPSFYALNVFLDIYNLFVSLLNILSFFND